MGHDRFARQLAVPGFGPAQQARLQASTVLVAGVGGVGGAAATYLAAAGVGRLLLAHPGALELPDLNRQTLMRADAVGTPRVKAAAETLAIHHPGVHIEVADADMADPQVGAMAERADLVVDARHNFPERYLLNRYCVRTRTPLVVASMCATELQLLVVTPGSPCLRCVFPAGDPDWQPLGFPVLGAVAGTVGCLAAMESIKILSGFGEPCVGRLFTAELRDLTVRRFTTARDPACPDCSDCSDCSARTA